MSALVIHLRAKIHFAGLHIRNRCLEILQLLSTRRRKLLLMERLLTMITIHQAQPTIQLLLSTNEYSGALGLIESTQQVLRLDMNGLSCFRHLSSQLSAMENAIIYMMKEDLSRCIITDLQRPLEDGANTVNPHHVSTVAIGLIRRNQFTFFDEFREVVKGMIKWFIKQHVLKFVAGASDKNKRDSVDQNSVLVFDDGSISDDSSGKDASLAGKMRLLNFDQWISMLDEIFASLCIFLRRSTSFLTVIVNTLGKMFLSTEYYAPESYQRFPPQPQAFSLPSGEFERKHFSMKIALDDTNGTGVLSDMACYEEDLMNFASSDIHRSPFESKLTAEQSVQDNAANNRLASCNIGSSSTVHTMIMKSSGETLSWTIEFAHDRCAKVLIAKNKDSSLDKLTSAELLTLARVIEKHLADVNNFLEPGYWSSQDTKYFLDNFHACYGNGLKGGNVLRGVLQSRSLQFINRFHHQRKTNLMLILNNETWKQADVPRQLSKILQGLSGLDDLACTEDYDVLGEASASATLNLNGIHFSICGSVLLLLKMVIEYIRCTDDLPTSTPDLIVRATELLNIYNSRSCQLVLGAGALQVVGLKTISTKNLGLVSRCLQLVLHLLPSIKHHFKQKLESYCPQIVTSCYQSCLKHFEHVAKAYENHISEINCKLLNIMDLAIESNLSKWQVKAPSPSKEFRTICRQILKFHEAVSDFLLKEQIVLIFEKLHSHFKQRLRQKFELSAITKDGSPQYGLVMSNLLLYEETVKSLQIIPEDQVSLHSVWT